MSFARALHAEQNAVIQAAKVACEDAGGDDLYNLAALCLSVRKC